MDSFFKGKKILAYFAVIFFLTLIIIFFVLEFRFLNKVVNQSEETVEHIVTADMRYFTRELLLAAEGTANEMPGGDENINILPVRKQNIAFQQPNVSNLILLNREGEVLNAANDRFVPLLPDKILNDAPFIFNLAGYTRENELAVVAPLKSSVQAAGYLVVIFKINSFINSFVQKYSANEIKAALLNSAGQAIIWPFGNLSPSDFKAEQQTLRQGGTRYTVTGIPVENSNLTLYFFEKENFFDAYRILTIMFLLFTLYFLSYQFIIELLKANNIISYFDDIDFHILNNLQEGIIISNKFNRIVFANNVVHDLFSEKEISTKKTTVNEVIGNNEEQNEKITLVKSNSPLEIMRSPIFKNGKLLGNLVVINASHEKQKMCGSALVKIIDLLPDGAAFVDKNNKVLIYNLMASYYLGIIKEGMNIEEVNPELAALIEENIGKSSLVRGALSSGNISVELASVYDENSFYTGVLIFLKDIKS